MKCEDCVYSEIFGGYIDMEKRKVITLYWCKRRNKTCKDMQEFRKKELKDTSRKPIKRREYL